MAQYTRVLAAKPEDLNSIPGVYLGKERLTPWLSHLLWHVYTHTREKQLSKTAAGVSDRSMSLIVRDKEKRGTLFPRAAVPGLFICVNL